MWKQQWRNLRLRPHIRSLQQRHGFVRNLFHRGLRLDLHGTKRRRKCDLFGQSHCQRYVWKQQWRNLRLRPHIRSLQQRHGFVRNLFHRGLRLDLHGTKRRRKCDLFGQSHCQRYVWKQQWRNLRLRPHIRSLQQRHGFVRNLFHRGLRLDLHGTKRRRKCKLFGQSHCQRYVWKQQWRDLQLRPHIRSLQQRHGFVRHDRHRNVELDLHGAKRRRECKLFGQSPSQWRVWR